MKRAIVLGLLIVVVAVCPAYAQGDFDAAFDELEEAFEETAKGEEEAWDKADAALEAQWEAQVRQTEAEWERLRAQVEQKWDEFYYSTNKEWVDYDAEKDTRSRVNFKDGVIEVTALVPMEEAVKPEVPLTLPSPESGSPPGERESAKLAPMPPGREGEKLQTEGKPAPPKPVALEPARKEQAVVQAKERIKKQVEKIFSAKNEVKAEVLADQVKDAEGQPVTPQNAAQYVEQEVIPQVTVEEKPVVGKDGQARIKVTARIKMVPRHLEIRASKFKPQVKKYADKYKLEPALVFAVIHTESYFNPVAKSWVPAYGLMQLVPRYGALEAYLYLYGEKKLLPADYLYNPDNNIMLGATYLHILADKYFNQIKDPANRRSLCIAAYNSGPTRLNKRVVGKYDVNGMDNKELVETIRRVVPDETKDYILKVQQRMSLYERIM